MAILWKTQVRVEEAYIEFYIISIIQLTHIQVKVYRAATSIDIIKILGIYGETSKYVSPHMPEVYFIFDSKSFLCSFYPFLGVCYQHQVNERIETKSLWYSRNRECAFDYVNEFVDKHIRVQILFVAGKLSFVM